MNIKLAICGVAVALISACGGGTSSVVSKSNGVAAVGAPLSGATITVLGANGVLKTTTADSEGNYIFPAGVTGPVLLKAEGGVGENEFTLYSTYPNIPGDKIVVGFEESADQPSPIYGTLERVNINTFTDVMTRQGLSGSDAIEQRFLDLKGLTMDDFPTLSQAVGNLAGQIGSLAAATGILTEAEFAKANPYTAEMKADKSSALDVLMEAFHVSCTGICDQYSITSKLPMPPYNTQANLGSSDKPPVPSGPGTQTAIDSVIAKFLKGLAKLEMTDLVLGCDDPTKGGTIATPTTVVCQIGKKDGTAQWLKYSLTTELWSTATLPDDRGTNTVDYAAAFVPNGKN